MDQKDIDEALTIAAALSAQAEASYLARGRHLQHLSYDDLVTARKIATASWAADPTSRPNPNPIADADAEFALRGIVGPHDDEDLAWLNEAMFKLQAEQISPREQRSRRIGFEALRKDIRQSKKH